MVKKKTKKKIENNLTPPGPRNLTNLTIFKGAFYFWADFPGATSLPRFLPEFRASIFRPENRLI